MTGPSAPRWVWVTRAEPGASATASRLIQLGFAPIVAPMIRTVDLHAVAPARSTYDALAFTSASAVRRFAGLSPSRDQAVFAVGDATAEAVRAQGWSDVISADADVIALGVLLTREAKGLRILHPCAEIPAGDLAASAEDVAVTALPAHVAVPPPWSGLPALLAQPGFLREEARPDALNVAQDFATWSGERHRADT